MENQIFKLDSCTICSEFPDDLKVLFKKLAGYDELNSLIKDGLAFKTVNQLNERLFNSIEYGLLIEDEIGNITELVRRFAEVDEIKHWFICKNLSIANNFLNFNIKRPTIVGLDFKLDPLPVTETQKFYEALKKKWNDATIMGITHFEKNNDPSFISLKNLMRTNGDSVYDKGEIKIALPNIIRDKVAISMLRNKISIVEEENRKLSEHVKLSDIRSKELELIIRYSDGMSITPEKLHQFDKKFNELKHQFRIYGNHISFNLCIFKAHYFANFNTDITIFGPSGSGKESIAKIVHHFSRRKHNELITVDCGRLDGDTIDSELFGHKKGSFTGATDNKTGYLFLANESTLFLDELQNLPASTQNRLLRFLESKKFRPKGDNTEIHSDIRLIAATSSTEAELQKVLVPAFFYRIVKTKIIVPSINERGNDKLIIAKQHLSYLNDTNQTSKRFDEDAENFILSRNYPGNIRELINKVEEAFFNSVDNQYVIKSNFSNSIQDATELSFVLSEEVVDCTAAERFLDQVELIINEHFDSQKNISQKELITKFPAKTQVGINKNTFIKDYFNPLKPCIAILLTKYPNKWIEPRNKCQFIRNVK